MYIGTWPVRGGICFFEDCLYHIIMVLFFMFMGTNTFNLHKHVDCGNLMYGNFFGSLSHNTIDIGPCR